MNLKTIKEFTAMAGVKKAAVSRAKKKNRVNYYRGGNTKPIQLDADDPLNKNYIESMNPGRMTNALDKFISPEILPATTGQEVSEETLNHMEDFAKGRAQKVNQEVKKLKIQNKHLEAIYLEKDVIYQGLILYIDRMHSTIDRFFGNVVDDSGPKILAAGQVTTEILQKSIDEGHKIIDDAKLEFLGLIREIIKDIENKK